MTENGLGEFLRARRRQVDPQELDLPEYGRRRVAGLRREELAVLAGVSPHYYARLEQGRDRHPSPQVIEALGRALRLDDEMLGYLRRLAEPAPPSRRASRRPERVSAELAGLLSRWTREPAVLIGRHRDVLAANALAVALNPGYAPGRNLVRDVFLDPAMREVYPDWERTAASAVSGLRAAAGTDLDGPRLTALVGELSLKSADFRRIWGRHDVREKGAGRKRFGNPLVGVLTLAYESFRVNSAPGQTLYLYLAEPGSRDEESLILLHGLAGGEAPAPVRLPG